MISFLLFILISLVAIPESIQFSSSSPSSSLSSTTTIQNDIVGEPAISRKARRDYEFHVAPMQCYTNYPLRKLFNLLSPSSVLWTEMEKVNDILEPKSTINISPTIPITIAFGKP